MEYIKKLWNEKPLTIIMIAGLLLRILAIIFSKGYGMHDDHFGPSEQPFEIILDPSIWENRGNVHGHSIILPYIHYLVFRFLELFGETDAQVRAFAMRLILGLYSIITVLFGYKIAYETSGKNVARVVGLVLALFWFLPFMSVRSLIELVTVPPMMVAFYYLIRNNKKSYDPWLVGLFFGLSFCFRYHTSFMLFALMWVWLFRKEFSTMIKALGGFLITIFLTQGIVDWVAWGYPLAAPIEYFRFSANDTAYDIIGPWYKYLVLMIGILIPPMSFALFYGFGRVVKKYYLIAIPALFFLIVHSITPHKQERYILPMMPIFITLAIIGWQEFIAKSDFWKKRAGLSKGLWGWFWIINSILLIIFTFTYSKKTRCESLTYLSDRSDVNGIYMDPGRSGYIQLPRFYLNKVVPIFQNKAEVTMLDVNDSISRAGVGFPNYAIFFGNSPLDSLEKRTSETEEFFEIKLEKIEEIDPSFLDDLLHTLNPRGNKNQTAVIYRIDHSGNQ